ncbi:MAG: MBL fold metallo-hydrolase [bacterium]
MLEQIRWLGHASFLNSAEHRIYINPWKLTTTEEADIILISHSHYDHFSAIDVALLPVGGSYTMDAQEAANTFRPRVAIPYRFGDIVGTRQDAERFAQSFTGETRILDEDGQP